MFTAKDLNPRKYPTTPEIDAHLKALAEKLNEVESAYGKPLVLSSGLRSQAQQDALIKAGKTKASKSKHLVGLAADIVDKDKALQAWVKANIPQIERIGFWMEAFESTPTWVHFQLVPPLSKSRFFKP